MPVANFQVTLGGSWKDYDKEEDKILKRAYMAGYPNCKYHLRGQDYAYDFANNKQRNLGSDKERDIRPPSGWKAPKKPIVPPGRTMTVTVAADKIGKTMEVPHPKDPTKTITVLVPKGAKKGQAMLVPVPPLTGGGTMSKAVGDAETKKKGGSTGKKVAVAGACLGGAVIAGAAGAGAVLVAEHGVDGAVDIVEAAVGDVGDAVVGVAEEVPGIAEDAGDAIMGFAEDAGGEIADFAGHASDFLMEDGGDIGDFVMDLF